MCNNNISLAQAIQNRRSVYGIGRDVSLSDDEIIGIVNNSVKYGPTPYHSQGGRAVILLGEHHQKLWDIARDIYSNVLPEEIYVQLEEKFLSFKAQKFPPNRAGPVSKSPGF